MLFRNSAVLVLLLIWYFVPIENTYANTKPGEPSHDTFLVEGHSAALPQGIREEAPLLSQAIKTPTLLKAIVPSLLAVKLNGEHQYNYTRQRLLHVVWSPTIPIAFRKLTI